MKLLDPNDPFFRNPAVRWGTVLVPAAMTVFELIYGGPGWAVVFGAAAGYAFWMLIVKGPDQGGPDQG